MAIHAISRAFLSLAVLAGLVALPVCNLAEAQRQQDNRALIAQEIKELPVKAKRYALVIGIDEYQDEQISRLSGAGNDAKALAAALVRYAGFPADQVILRLGSAAATAAQSRQHPAISIEPAYVRMTAWFRPRLFQAKRNREALNRSAKDLIGSTTPVMTLRFELPTSINTDT